MCCMPKVLVCSLSIFPASSAAVKAREQRDARFSVGQVLDSAYGAFFVRPSNTVLRLVFKPSKNSSWISDVTYKFKCRHV